MSNLKLKTFQRESGSPKKTSCSGHENLIILDHRHSFGKQQTSVRFQFANFSHYFAAESFVELVSIVRGRQTIRPFGRFLNINNQTGY